MNRLSKFIIVTSCIFSFVPQVFAEIVETAITLPDDLGTATLYSNKTQTKATAGILVIHEWWGLNDYAKNRAKMLAEEGYTAIAVDMYGHGKVADHPNDAKGFMNAAMSNPDKMNARFNAAKAILKEQQQVNSDRVYAMGYCFGGAVVLNQARLGNDLAGVASFHGSLGSSIKPNPGDIKAKIFVAHGGADPFVPVEQVTNFMQEMVTAGADLQFINFPQAKHSFTNPEATQKGEKFNLPLAYDNLADTQSWQAFLAFIEE